MVTESEIMVEFDVVEGVIRTPGKFECEAVYAPYFFELYMEGYGQEAFEECECSEDESCACDHAVSAVAFTIGAEDVVACPSLAGSEGKLIRFYLSDQGFWSELA